MTTTPAPLAIAQTSSWTEAFHAIYTDSEMMLAYLGEARTLRAKLDRSLTCARTAADPRGRFGLETVPADVVDVIAAFRAALELRIAPVRAEVVELRARGLAWDEVWGIVDRAHGFGPGDAVLLGVSPW